ncbi:MULTISPECIES: DUF4249 domain-containing protein [unclassified Spirosoma]|uniref:DUF4249 domain-containing protein n=1 Tax=unclassified Spirosoma TaxID=2621999 RepID=UPI000968FECE|nr:MULTISPECIES: DUF4249 domain-containing protein [unclassified Spirosoma]MBN8826200.1 DUF4249 domain-containing protein [Spirosoma sp.]OJW76904.1 MAG: hypothetical protein BGO59_22015 [Spirosoma sp. 48-14]
MRAASLVLLVGLTTLILPTACVDLLETPLTQRVNVIVVDGTLTNLNEDQKIHINRAKSDSLTGRFGSLPITKARVEVVVDSAQVLVFTETDTAGAYRSPAGFRAQPGHAYQLRFTLSDGTQYRSTTEVMVPVPAIDRVHTKFNPASLPAILGDGTLNQYRGAHEVTIDFQDPVEAHNYYRWDWLLWEKQDWCRTCINNEYVIALLDRDPPILIEDCYGQKVDNGYFVSDYQCRTQCWEILRNYTTNVFDDVYSNGGQILGRSVAQIPFYQQNGCLVQLRQSSLTKAAYQYYRTVEEQTQNNGGVATTPPTGLVGNIRNVANGHERVIGYFTASSVAVALDWIDRKDATGRPPGLFIALNNRPPSQPFNTGGFGSKDYPTATCVPSDGRTPNKPVGWRD